MVPHLWVLAVLASLVYPAEATGRCTAGCTRLLRLAMAASQARRRTFTGATKADVGASLGQSWVSSPHGVASMPSKLHAAGKLLTVRRLTSLWAF